MDYAKDIITGESIRDSAKHCKVANSTSFRWRHRMLSHLERKARKRGGKASQRGVSSEQTSVLIVRDRNGNTTDTILEKSNQDTLADILIPIIDKDTLLCSDKKTSYTAFAKKYHYTLETINSSAKEYTRGIFHVQNVNAYDSRLKAWMKHFHGVATKYLTSYLGWMRLLDREKDITVRKLLAVIAGRDLFLYDVLLYVRQVFVCIPT